MTAHRLGRRREVSRTRLGRGADCVAHADVEWQYADGPWRPILLEPGTGHSRSRCIRNEPYIRANGTLSLMSRPDPKFVLEAEERLRVFNASQPASLTTAEREQLARLSSDLERVWHDPRADGSLRNKSCAR